jgi:hypothetical protein
VTQSKSRRRGIKPTATELVARYFELAPRVDAEPYFAQFAHDAIAEDEGATHYGIEAIRAWRATVPPVTYTVRDVQSVGDEHIARAEITGEFPGSPVTLAFGFTFADDGRIRTLAIRV